MFGYVRPYGADLSEEEKKRYKAVYCGLCRELNEKYGLAGRMGLNFDMTFLLFLLGSLYEPEEKRRETVCPPHPVKKHPEVITPFTEYAAGMTVALTYYKALDDWEDERKASGKVFSDLLRRRYQAVKSQWPLPCEAIEKSIDGIHEVEKDPKAQPERAADLSGRMLSAVFAVKDDYFRPHMAALGYYLGKFIYMMDAAVDYDQDLKKGCYNPLTAMELKPENAGDMLRQPLGQAAEIFEGLPLVQDVNILRNILYSGVWQSYNEMLSRKKDQKKADSSQQTEGEQHGH